MQLLNHRHDMLEFLQNILAALETMLVSPSIFREFTFSRRKTIQHVVRPFYRPLEEFAQEIEGLFTDQLNDECMLSMSEQMRIQFRDRLQNSPHCMLPSYNHTLPNGQEKGTYLALDVGGSTFRVALVELSGRDEGAKGLRIIRIVSSAIDNSVKLLPGTLFFDWMAQKIEAMLADVSDNYGHQDIPLPMGLAWSFPIEQTSIRGGLLLSMGKGFHCSNDTIGQDLGELIMQACQRRNLNVKMDAIVNDSSATLLSRAYTDSATRISIILGTGTNAAIHLPVSAVGSSKFGNRPQTWHDRASHVLVNSELSMFGRGVLPTTRWDDHLNRTHLLPDYQPLEYMITGRYLGEIVRLILLEAVKTAGLFGGTLPLTLSEPYSLDTAIVAVIEGDDSPTLSISRTYIQTHHSFPNPPTPADLLFLRTVCCSVSRRSAAYLATGIHALYRLRSELETEASQLAQQLQTGLPSPAPSPIDDCDGNGKLTIACEGSIINKYPGFRDRCQNYIERTIKAEGKGMKEGDCVVLETAFESAIVGAAVAVACVETDEKEVMVAGKEAEVLIRESIAVDI